MIFISVLGNAALAAAVGYAGAILFFTTAFGIGMSIAAGALVARALGQGMAIVGRMTPVAFGVVFALSGAIGPIIGQNFGAGRMDRVQQAYRDGLLFCGILTVAMTGILSTLRGPIIAIFKAEGVTQELLILFCGPRALAFSSRNAICDRALAGSLAL